MITTFRGRTLPFNDWEGDDVIAGPGWETCMDTSVGRAACWATNGRVCFDGRQIRKAVIPPDPDGISFDQADKALHRLNEHLHVEHPHDWTQRKVTAWLRAGKGLIVTGIYSDIPRAYRHQRNGDFAHAMFVTHINNAGTLMRLYDPLNPDVHERGRQVPVSILWPFLDGRNWQCGYVPLHPIKL
jgi:hypothetical protein